MYISKLYNEINIWKKIRKIVKSEEKALNEKGFRIDWVGRIYTVINLPEEVATAPISQEGYVLMKLREHDQFLLQLGIADYVSPEFEKIEGTDSFLLILSPDRDYMKLWPFLVSMFKTVGLILILRLLYVILEHNHEKSMELWNKLTTLIF
tara:strand:+ start:2266 stop:2718 length:453 start_codon:yes stop_codon:yes gene_type:complete